MKCNLPKPEKAQGNLQMNLYDLNKQIISQLPSMTDEDLCSAIDIINTYKNESNEKYYMLLCNELKYYTLFAIHADPQGYLSFGHEVTLCLKEFADEVKVIDKTEDQMALEIWISKNEEVYVMYLFGYEKGVIDCE